VTPVAAFVPLMVVFFGLGLTARIAVVFLFSVAYVAVSTMTGVKQARQDLAEMGRSFSLTSSQAFRWVVLPSALPLIVAGLRISFPRALTGMLLSELILSSVGIGYLLLEFGAFFATAKLFATILVILALAMMGGFLINQIDRKVNAWLIAAGARSWGQA
jgi:ABC-type nitrate/sulfonate/bicarbonate transport system permease component